jgi:hypothetical protein
MQQAKGMTKLGDIMSMIKGGNNANRQPPKVYREQIQTTEKKTVVAGAQQ